MAVSDKSKAVRLTVRILEKLKPGEEARDSEVSGLIAHVGPTGIHFRFRKVMRLGSRGDSPRSQTAVHMTLGTYPHVTLEQARQTAAVYAAQVRRGIDP